MTLINTPLLRFYGRRRGRAMTATRQGAFDRLEHYTVKLPDDGLLEPQTLHPDKKTLRLEIGFGSGEHLVAEAANHKDIGFIGAEPFINGISKCIQQLEDAQLTNIRIWPEDARLLLDRLKPESLDGIYILFSDPWRKARHADRRFVSDANLARLARVIKHGGMLRIATDDPGLQEWTIQQMANQTFFVPNPGLHDTRPDWPNTRYEGKAVKAGRHCMYWEYKRV